MIEANNQETVNKTQNPDIDKSPLASALFRHLREYYQAPPTFNTHEEYYKKLKSDG